jgi:hypothetical protein
MRIRFSIRDLLWLTLAAALAVGWWLDHRRLTSWQTKFEAAYKGPLIQSHGVLYNRQ